MNARDLFDLFDISKHGQPKPLKPLIKTTETRYESPWLEGVAPLSPEQAAEYEAHNAAVDAKKARR